MICPQCGHEMGGAHRCLRCGYEVKNLATVDPRREKEDGDGKKREDENNTKVIDPSNVYISGTYDDGYDGGFVDPFASIFDDIFADPLTSILGGLFGFDIRGESQSARRREEEPHKKKKKQGPVVEVDNVEFFDADGNKIDSDRKRVRDAGKPSGGKPKNPFRRNNNNR